MNLPKIRTIAQCLAISSLGLLSSCDSGSTTNENLLQSSIDTTSKAQKISDQAIGDIIKSIPSPLEISVLIKESGGEYNKNMLNSDQNYSKYNSSFKKSLNLGIYGADLGYINIYNQNTDALLYLTSIKSLADELSIGQFYDFATIKRLASNSNNIDSLLYITTSNFEKINNFLYEQKRSEHCVLILTGGWLEALHISCEVASKSKNDKVIEKVGEQKIVLEQLLLLLSNYQDQENINFVHSELTKLKQVYDKVKITYTYNESTMKEVDGVLMIVNETESKVEITNEQLEQINSIVSNLRSKIIA